MADLDPNPVRVALVTLLKEDSDLSKVSNGVYYGAADATATRPYTIVQKMAGNPHDAFDGPSLDRDVWLVKGVGSAAQAETIDRCCQKLLRGATLEIEGKANQDLRKIADVDYVEAEKGETYRHSGAEYKIDSEDEE